jgi:uncharacterized integral membrane protein (TIGR00697 family)
MSEPTLTKAPPGYRAFHALAMIFVFSLLVANTIAVKIITLGSFTVPAGIIVFPIAYIFGDVLTETYGFEKTRSVIWWGFGCLLAMAAFYWIATLLPPAPFWKDQEAFARLFGFVPRIAVSSLFAYLVGEFLNSAVLSKMKIVTNGKHFWLRAIASTIVGQGADSIVFNFAAFLGVFPVKDVVMIALSGWVLKSLYEVLALPVTYPVVRWVKRIEGIDSFDHGVSYRPIAFGKDR